MICSCYKTTLSQFYSCNEYFIKKTKTHSFQERGGLNVKLNLVALGYIIQNFALKTVRSEIIFKQSRLFH